MRIDDPMREELARAGAAFRPDAEAAFERVVEREARGRRHRRIAAVSIAAVIVVGTGVTMSKTSVIDLGRTPGPATHQTVTTHPDNTNGGRQTTPIDPLTGEWQSVALTSMAFRQAMLSAGATPANASRVLAGVKHWVVQMTFRSTLVVETWDPARPTTSLQISKPFGVRMLPGNRLAILSLQPGNNTRWMVGYRRSADHLQLHDLGVSAATSSDDAAKFAGWASAPLTLVHTR